MTYKHLTQEQRYQIYALLKTAHSQSKMAEVIGVHRSTINRELKRNQGKRGYRPQQAHRMAVSRQKKAPAPDRKICMGTGRQKTSAGVQSRTDIWTAKENWPCHQP